MQHLSLQHAQHLLASMAAALTAWQQTPVDVSTAKKYTALTHHLITKAQMLDPVIVLRREAEEFYLNGHKFTNNDRWVSTINAALVQHDLWQLEIDQDVSEAELAQVLAKLAQSGVPDVDMRTFIQQTGISSIVVERQSDDSEQRSLEVYREAKDYIINLWEKSQQDQIPSGKYARRLVAELGGMLTKAPNMLMGLTMLSGYDNYTFSHSVNVGLLAMALADELGMQQERARIGLGGMLHDIGKTYIQLEIITKPGKLTPQEWELMKKHPEFSGEIAKQMHLFDIVDIVEQHHAGYNRKGYPQLKAQTDLSEGAMITAICDIYDSVTSLRPYQRQFTPQEGIHVLLRHKSNKYLNPDFVDVFIDMLGLYPIGTTVLLNSGEIAIVCGIHPEYEDRPQIKIIRDQHGRSLAEPMLVDLAAQTSPTSVIIKRRVVSTIDPAPLGIRPADYIGPNVKWQVKRYKIGQKS